MFIVGWYQPGEVEELSFFVFGTFERAKTFLIHELEDDLTTTDEGDVIADYDKVIEYAKQQTEPFTTPIVDLYHYFIATGHKLD